MESIEKLLKLSKQYKEIKTYPFADIKTLYKGIGRVPGTFSDELLKFLKATNGASILDYCILGIKNNKLGIDIDKYVYELWHSYDFLAGNVVGFMINSTGETFGYLMGSDFKNLSYESPIVYFSDQSPNDLHIIGTSFDRFMKTFLEDVEYTLVNSTNEILLEVEIPDWPINVTHWMKHDKGLVDLYNEIGINKDGIIQF